MVARERQKCLVSDFCSPCQIRSSIVTNLLLINQTALEFQSITRETHFNPIFKDLKKSFYIFYLRGVKRLYEVWLFRKFLKRGLIFKFLLYFAQFWIRSIIKKCVSPPSFFLQKSLFQQVKNGSMFWAARTINISVFWVFFEPAARGRHEKEQKIVLFCIQSLLQSESTLMNFLKIRKQYKRKQEEKEIRR